ncbi:cupin domain-containing protein [Streptomyces sp. CB03238]|uniref:cupin domain-containing protein n=1 Tax=Streptomyces sp. CB03238 TaxID=1907777 RepID=UPI0015C45CDB|nr:cupin domain-containing protein [Streptomyces sp. CB03238]
MVEHRILGPEDGELYQPQQACGDRFLVNSREWGGHFSLVEHRLPPKVLAAPVHRHTHEDEFSFILEGSVGARFGDEEVVARPGDLVFKPRDEWHTFWNAGETPARLLEIISPGGLEELFRWLDQLGGEPSPEQLEQKARPYGCSTDMDATMALIAKHGLVF